ncbi:glucose dehydrogenase [Tardibacter chloracetimidivorans]|uniref:Glucose dehydrogenase n=1 Tax=Tardibacter chloracetimidivorans TaxID=1921510 RepID=A0A1L3ZTU5_9SPHN|nr:PQQ-dependent sugar dehydrogenase [Tardibacter chloracetimidivorans]API59062.1 glucose dehydrogenase [Tardibacter chloracetimidivorans]
MRSATIVLGALLCACSSQPAPAATEPPFTATPVATFDEPWAMTFLPDGRLLVTEKAGRLLIVTRDGKKSAPLSGTPKVHYAGQAGLMDVALHPDFANNRIVYLSYSEPGEGGTSGTALARATLTETALENLQVIWRQEPKVTGNGHYSGRIAFSPDGYMFVTSGDRQKMEPAQDMNQNLGKVVRLTDTGMIPSTNPYYDQGRIKAQIWSLGHRNLLGIALDKAGNLWTHEIGPRGGDEFNLVRKGENYGWPKVSEGRHYGGTPIPAHLTDPKFIPPKVSWTPVISPAGLIIYSGDLFPEWKGSALIGGLSSEALVRVAIDGQSAREAERFEMGRRIREVEQGPDGAVWLLEDDAGGRLLKLTPSQ